jgi:hypothetical protein
MTKFIRIHALALAVAAAGCATSKLGTTFATPEAALHAFAEIAGKGDKAAVERIFGEGSVEVFQSGDEVADRRDGARVGAMIREKLAFEEDGEKYRIALLGKDGWPFPIPLVKSGDGWAFDVDEGKEELLNRRVGRNEISTLATLHAYVQMQREYRSAARDGKKPAYAQRFISTEGKHDGLHWPSAEGEPESPLGPLVAEATGEGYRRKEGGPTAYHGYYYRILTGQGKHAPGGAKNHIDKDGLMTGGFGAVAWPAEHGSSGVMTFIVNDRDLVFQKDLGPSTETAVAAITLYDPDESWSTAGD